MTVRLSVAIMAHRKREAFVRELLAKLDRPAEVVFDRRDDRWDTGRRSWQAIDKTASHGFVLQDDAVIPRDLVAGIENALGHVPEKTPLCLYAGRVRPFRDLVQQLVNAAEEGASWLTMTQIHWGVGIVLPVALIDDMVAWCDDRDEIANYDRRISRWVQHQGLSVYYPWPSLVDHRDSPSLVPNRGSAGRRAHRFLGADKSVLDCDWSGAVVTIPALSTASQYLPRYPPPPAAPPRKRKPRLGVAVKFRSTKYPQLQVYKAGVRFKGGLAETRDPDAVAELLKLRHMGVEPVEPEASNGAESALSAEAPQPPEPSPAPEQVEAPPAADEQVAAPADDQLPDGGAKEILSWVADDPAKARQALDAEQTRDKPRSTLVAALTKLAG